MAGREGESPEREVAPEVRELSRRLLPESDLLGERIAERIRGEVPFYAEGSMVPFDDLVVSCIANVHHVLGRLGGGETDSSDRPRETGVARAVQGAPYAAVLQAFRIGSRLIWEFMVERAEPQDRDTLLHAAADIWTVSDELSATVTEAYRAAVADQSRRDRLVRTALVEGLFEGDRAVAGRHLEAAGVLGFGRGAGFVVVSAECPVPGVESLPDVGRELERRGVISVWRLDRHHQDGLVELRPGFDAGHLTDWLAELAQARVGLSAVFAEIGGAPEGRHQARLAAAAAAPSSREVVRYDDEPLPVLLASAPQQARLLVTRVLGKLLALPAADRDMLLETARAWLAHGGSTSAAANELYLHRNTVRYRLRRLESVTGRDLANPVDAAEMFVALEAVRILGHSTDP